MTENQAARILYEMERQGLITMQGETIDEVRANIVKAREVLREMTEGTSK